LKRFHNSLQNQDSTELTTFLVQAGKHGLLHSCSLSCAQLLDAWLTTQWETLSQDPLEAKAIPLKGKKAARRLDPTLKRAFSELAERGQQNFELAKRLGAARALEHVKKLPSAAALDESHIAGLFSQRKFLVSEQAAEPQISIAMDASRVGGEKTLVMFALHLQQNWHLWLPPQAVRDFAPQAEHQLCSPGDSLQARWSLGLKIFSKDFSEHAWKNTSGEPSREASEKTKPARARNTTEGVAGHERMSSYDLLVCLDNALRSLGLGLASFAPKPTSQGVKAKGDSHARRKQKGRKTKSAEEEAAMPEAPQAAPADLAEETDTLEKAASAPLGTEAAKSMGEEEEAAEPAHDLAEASEPQAALADLAEATDGLVEAPAAPCAAEAAEPSEEEEATAEPAVQLVEALEPAAAEEVEAAEPAAEVSELAA
jgi:hypothetical protein